MFDLIIYSVLIFSFTIICAFLSKRIYTHIIKYHPIIKFFIIFPGVAIHELSHLVVALVTFRKIHSCSLYSTPTPNSTMGYVSYRHRKPGLLNYFFDGLIGLAPLAGAVLSLLALSYIIIPVSVHDFLINEIPVISISRLEFDALLNQTHKFVGLLLIALGGGVSTFIWIYFASSISLSALPSAPDMKIALPSIIILLLLFIISISIFDEYELLITWYSNVMFKIVLVVLLILFLCLVPLYILSLCLKVIRLMKN